MSDKIADALRAEAEMIKGWHKEGVHDAHIPMTPYQMWCVLDSMAERLDGGRDSCNRWSLHQFVPRLDGDAP